MNNAGFFCLKTPIGPIAIRYEQTPFRLTGIDLRPGGKEAASAPCAKSSVSAVNAVNHMILQYFQGVGIDPPWKILSMDHLTPLQQKVLYETVQIPYGTQKTYKWIAGAIGRPRACRFVGSALGKNPFPLIIPCHRVIRSDGRIGHFGSGPALKKWLIDFESRQ